MPARESVSVGRATAPAASTEQEEAEETRAKLLAALIEEMREKKAEDRVAKQQHDTPARSVLGPQIAELARQIDAARGD